MRLASYNILDGGEGRADPLAEVLLAQRADVIAIIEADNQAVLQRLAQRLGMDYVVAPGVGHSVALFSRWAIGSTVNYGVLKPAGPRAFLVAEIERPSQPRDQPLIVGALHLHPRADEADEDVRVAQLYIVLNAFADYRAHNRAHVLMGDFNANAPVQIIDPSQCKPSTRQSWERNGSLLPRRAIQLLFDHGYVDTLNAAKPQAGRTLGSFTTQHPGQRVDYIFTWGIEASRIRDAWIEHDRLAKFASDHFPVGCEIE